MFRTQTDYDNALTLKSYLFQFVNFYSSIFYLAFFKGRLTGRPSSYNRLFGFRQEECAPEGCFMEVAVQMAMIFLGKQQILQVMEYYIPLVWKGTLYHHGVTGTVLCVPALNMMNLGVSIKISQGKKKASRFVKDFKLAPVKSSFLFHEYLEIVIQFGFITLFACTFPIAPFFALINNILEIRSGHH